MKNTNYFKKYFILEILIVIFVIAFDLFLKAYSEINLKGQSIPLIKGIVNLTYVENSGAAFGMLKDKQIFFKILTVIALGVFMYFLYRNRNENILLKISLALIIGGTTGNFIDRVNLNYVRDMIELKFINFAVFNIADSALTIGVILFAIYYLFIYKEPEKKDNNENTNDKTEEKENIENKDIAKNV